MTIYPVKPTLGYTDYYISNLGDVNNSGLSSQFPKTFAGIATVDKSTPCRFLFNRGETFEGSLTISNPNISLDYYGSGNAPIFIGSSDISGVSWTDEGDGTWSTVMSEPNWIYIDGLRAKISQTPEIAVTSYPATNQLAINNADVAGYGAITGSRLIFIPNNYATEYLYTVQSYAASVITINQATVYQSANFIDPTLILCMKKAYLSGQNEWAYEGGKLYIKTTVSPATMDIRSSTYVNGITISDGCGNVAIRNIEFKDYYYSAIKRNKANNVTIDSCAISNCSDYGIAFTSNPHIANITNTIIYNCDGGIYDAASRNINVQYCTIYNIGVGSTLGSTVDYTLISSPNKAMYIRDRVSSGMFHGGGEVSYNRCFNLAYVGIQIQGYAKVHHNIVHDFMQVFEDGGGIYTYQNPNYQSAYTEIYNNIVYDAPNGQGRGIYCDTRGGIYVSIHDNVVYNMYDAGININWDNQATSIYNNILVGNGKGIRYSQLDDYTEFQISRSHNFNNNIIASRDTSGYCHYADVMDATANYNPFSYGGSSNNNKFVSPYINRIGYHTSDTSMTLSEMRTRYSTDASSTERVNYKTYVSVAQAEIDVTLYTNETSDSVIQSVGVGYIDVDGNSVTQVIVPAYGGVVVLKS